MKKGYDGSYISAPQRTHPAFFRLILEAGHVQLRVRNQGASHGTLSAYIRDFRGSSRAEMLSRKHGRAFYLREDVALEVKDAHGLPAQVRVRTRDEGANTHIGSRSVIAQTGAVRAHVLARWCHRRWYESARCYMTDSTACTCRSRRRSSTACACRSRRSASSARNEALCLLC